VVLRLGLREAASSYRSPQLPRVNALPAEPPDPETVGPIARRLAEELAHEAAEGEASPTVRLLKKTFRPNEAEKTRRSLEKAFNAYLKVWQEKEPA
jgi:hypothetical protein